MVGEGPLLYSPAMPPVRMDDVAPAGAPPGPVTADRDERAIHARARLPDRMSVLAVLCVGAAVLPVVVATVRAIAGGWRAITDNAYFGIRAGDVLTEHHPLLGTWTSASLSVGMDINNPGPLQFDALALPVKLAGDAGDAGLAAGVALINVAAIVGIAVVARRQAGARGVVAGMLATSGLAWTMGSELLFDPWQPNSLLLPVLCFLTMVWALACGDHAVLPWTVGLASFIVQTHIGYAFFVPALGLWGVGAVAARLWRLRRDDAGEWRQRRRSVQRHLGAALVVGVACWSQSLYEQFFVDGRGNLGQLVSSARRPQERLGAEFGARVVADVLTLPPWWGRPSFGEALAGVSLPSLASSVIGLAVVAALLTACMLVTRRRDAPARAAAATALVVFGVTLMAAATMPTGVWGVAPHHLRWLWPVALFVTFTLVLCILPTPGREPVRARIGMGLVALATLTLSGFNLPHMNSGIGPSADAHFIPVVRELMPQLTSVKDERGVLFDGRGLRFGEPFSVRLLWELERLGVSWFVDEHGLAKQLGPSRLYSGGASVRLFLREGDAARETPPGVRRVAFVEGLNSVESAELADVKAELTSFIADRGLVLRRHLSKAQRLTDFAEVPALTDARLRDPEYLLAEGTASPSFVRALVYLVVDDRLDVPARWDSLLERYADLQFQADRLTVALFAEPLETTR